MNNLYIWFNAIVANHNWSISLLYNWKIFSIELERLNRLKDFPNNYISKILPSLQREMFNNIDSDTNDYNFAYSFRNYIDEIINEIIIRQWIDLSLIDNIYTINFPFDISVRWYENKVHWYKYNYHHLFHACSTYYPSNFEESVILCMDHDWYDADLEWGINVMHTIWHAKWNEIKCIYYDKYDPKLKKVGIWMVYDIHADICWVWEGTLMWLSWYWNNRLNDVKIFDYSSWWVFLDDSYFGNNNLPDNLKSWYEVNDFVDNIIIENFRRNYSIDWINIPEDIENSIYADISDKVQKDIEEAILFLARKAYDLTKCKNICIAWWVWLNIIANNRVLRETDFENIFVQPACSDSGLSLWAVYYLYHNILWNKDRIIFDSPWLWFEYNDLDIKNILNLYNDKIDFYDLWDLKYKKIASLLKDNKIIWWFQWKSEFWPRALWFRSILASPSDNNMKVKVNNIKNRQQYRPLAPIILEDYFSDYLNTDYKSPYMTLVSNVKKDKINLIPAVTHIDWTSRYQTVNKNQNPEIYNLLIEFYNQTWIPLLINTSFNQKDEPIVEKPEDAIKMFISSDIDYLVIWSFLVKKDKNFLNYKYDENIQINNFELKLSQAKNNNIRWELILKLLWISKLGFEYNYESWTKWVLLKHNNLLITIEIINKDTIYYKKAWEIWVLYSWYDDNLNKIFKIIEIYLEKNNNVIFNLLKWI